MPSSARGARSPNRHRCQRYPPGYRSGEMPGKGRRERDSLISAGISLIARFNSLLGGKKFPVRMRRELTCKTLILPLFLLPLTRRRAPDRMKFPVFSLLTGNFKAGD